MQSDRPTITDVAREAGVSKATVSAVLNDAGSVKDSTRARVLEVIARLNYRPTQLARQDRVREGKSLGIIVKEIDNPYYADVVLGARSCAERTWQPASAALIFGTDELVIATPIAFPDQLCFSKTLTRSFRNSFVGCFLVICFLPCGGLR